MNLKDCLYGDEWPGASCEDLVCATMSDATNIVEENERLAAMFGRLLDVLPLSDKQRFEIIGQYRWELKSSEATE
jgi:hypothetical protein